MAGIHPILKVIAVPVLATILHTAPLSFDLVEIEAIKIKLKQKH